MTFERRAAGLVVAVVLAVLVAGCANTPVAPALPPGGLAGPASPPSVSIAAALDPPSGADVRFVSMMLPHHEQGLVLTGLVPQRTASPALARLAFTMDRQQVEEIGQMRGLLRVWERSLPPPTARTEPGMRTMMGMATEAQLAELARRRGSAFDTAWLAVMTRHHQGAVAMAREVLAEDPSRSVGNLAESVLGVQLRQIAAMARIAAGGP